MHLVAPGGDDKPLIGRRMTYRDHSGDDTGETCDRDEGDRGWPATVPRSSPEPGCAEDIFQFLVAFVVVALGLSPVIGIVLVSSWNNFTDVPLKYVSGDKPRDAEIDRGYDDCARWAEVPQACHHGLPHGGSDDWLMNAGSEISTTYRPEGRPRIDSLARRIELHAVDAPCDARVEWTIAADSDELATSTVDGWPGDELGDVEIPSRRAPERVTITARRTDDADCRTVLRWVDPGFNGPGLGKFRLF